MKTYSLAKRDGDNSVDVLLKDAVNENVSAALTRAQVHRIHTTLNRRRDWIEKANVEITKMALLENENAILKKQIDDLDKANKARIIRALANKPEDSLKYAVVDMDGNIEFYPRPFRSQVSVLVEYFEAHGHEIDGDGFIFKAQAVSRLMKKEGWKFERQVIT